MPTASLAEQRSAAIKAARDLIEAAKTDNRELTTDELKSVQEQKTKVGELDKQIAGKSLVDSVMQLDASEGERKDDDKDTPAKSLGEHFAKSLKGDTLARLKSISGYTVSSPEFVPSKANTDPQVTTGAVFGPLLTTVDRTIVRAYRPGPVVADLLGSGSISGNAISYFIEGAVEGGFATVGETGQKPQMHFTDPTTRTDALKKIAAWWDMSDEMTEDLDFFVSEINNRGMYLLGMFEEAQLLNGNGTGTNVLGLLNRSGIQTEVSAAGGGDDADALFRAMTKVQTATGLAADGIVINPMDYQRLRLSRDANNQYFGGGYFQGEYGNGSVLQQPPLWGLRTVVTSAVAAGTALVGAFNQAGTVYRKGGVRVESTNSDQGKFTSNIVTTRVEERLALAVRIPSAVVKVTFTA
ncbi:phage major capsid protein [Kribbella sp. WER1]